MVVLSILFKRDKMVMAFSKEEGDKKWFYLIEGP